MKIGHYAAELGPRRALLASFLPHRPKVTPPIKHPPSSSSAAADLMIRFLPPPQSISTKCSISELLLDREWMLPNPAAEIHKISLSGERIGPASSQFSYSIDRRPDLGAGMEQQRGEGSTPFYIVRDDLLHPLVNGNKARKLDGVLPILQRYSATDVVTCGGCQSAHAAAVAVSCAERGISPHLLLRGEQPEIPTGYNLVSLMYGHTSYIARSLYAQREEMLNKHADLVAGSGGSVVWIDDILGKGSDNGISYLNGCRSIHMKSKAGKGQRRVVIINEGAGKVAGLLGVVRLVRYLSQFHLFGTEQHVNFVVDAGTGTTAIGLALGAACLGIPWKVTAVMLADTVERYKEREKCLISDFKRIHQLEFHGQALSGVDDCRVHWVERVHSRKFGKVLKGEIEMCRQIARQTGILVDPVYTLAAWEHAILLSHPEAEKDAKVVMLHTGGTLGMFGLAQRYSPYFRNAEQATDDSLS